MTGAQLNQLIAWSTVAVALATIVLAVLTGLYLKATNRLVRLQREPNLHIGLPNMFNEGQEIVIQNGGADSIINIAVYPRHFIFADPNEAPIMSQGRPPEMPGGDRSAWWFIPKLGPDEMQKKSLAEELKIYSRNREAMKSHTEGGQEPTCLFLLDEIGRAHV